MLDFILFAGIAKAASADPGLGWEARMFRQSPLVVNARTRPGGSDKCHETYFLSQSNQKIFTGRMLRRNMHRNAEFGYEKYSESVLTAVHSVDF